MLGIAQNTLPITSCGTGAGGLAPGVESLPAIETRLLFVDKGANVASDGSRQEPYHTVAAALAQAAVLAPTVNSRVAILIYPGEYAEDGLNSVDYVDMVGVGPRGAVRIEGAAATTYTVDDAHTTHWNIIFANTGAFRILTVTGAMSTSALFVECAFEGAASDASCAAVVSGADAEFQDCRFTNAGILRAVLGSDVGSVLVLRRCIIAGNLSLSSLAVTMEGCTVGGLTELNTMAPVELRGNTFVSDTQGIIIYAIPVPGIIHNNRIVSGAGCYDLIAAGPITGLYIEGNVMTRGIHGLISHVKPERNVGAAGNLDFYPTLQFALDSCTFDDITVKLLVDVNLAATLTTPAFVLTIDGNGKHTITRAAGGQITTLGANSSVTFRDVDLVGRIDILTNPVVLLLENCTMLGRIYSAAAAGNTVTVRRSVLFGDVVTANAIYVSDTVTVWKFEWSYIRAVSGFPFPALVYNAVNNNVYAKYSTFYYGNAAADPFSRTAAQTPTWHSHHDQFNSIPGAGWLTNVIPAGQSQDSVDVNGDY